MTSDKKPLPRRVQQVQFAMVLATLFVLIAFADTSPWFTLGFMAAVIAVNLVMVAVVRVRTAAKQVDAIFEEELGRC